VRVASEHALERLDPTGRHDLEGASHWARYLWACRLLPARRVLDCACGLGYGSRLLEQHGAEQVLGVDVSAETVQAATASYGGPAVAFRAADALKLSRADVGTFDRIVSLETIEHVSEPCRLLDVFLELLEPDGVLAISCPNDRVLGGGNPYHLWVSDHELMRGWLQERFRHVQSYLDLRFTSAGVWPMGRLSNAPALATGELLTAHCGDGREPGDAEGFLFACTNAESPAPAVEPLTVPVFSGMRYVREMQKAIEWLAGQREAWETAARNGEASIQQQKVWSEQVEQGKTWLEQQVASWRAAAERQRSIVDQQHTRIHNMAGVHKAQLERLARRIAELENELQACRAALDAQAAQRQAQACSSGPARERES